MAKFQECHLPVIDLLANFYNSKLLPIHGDSLNELPSSNKATGNFGKCENQKNLQKKEVDFIQSRFRPEKNLLINFLVRGQMPDNYRNIVGKIYYSFVDLGKSSIESTQENE